jgi:amidase/aspartyl-tRNA(Asn)/glutamyl-tRNA(Gln) amidotransferase subunit A
MILIKISFSILVLLAPLSNAYAKPVEDMTIPEIHKQMQEQKISSEALLTFYLERIKAFDDNGNQLNAVVQLNPKAIAEAKSLDNYYVQHGFKGKLHGIPVLLKDNIDSVNSMANTAGSHALANNFPKDDAFLVQQLKAAGAIILGKTNLSEWANFRSTQGASGWSGLYGQTKNPYDITRSPCGSSSGSAVAVAANFATIAVGTETDGSITCPAAMNGVVGIKPTIGTVSRKGIIPIAHSQDTAGSMANNVTNAVLLLAAMVKFDANDSAGLVANIDYSSHLKLDGIKGKRIGIARNLTGYHKGVDKLFFEAVALLKSQGAIIVDNTNFSNAQQWSQPEFEVLLYEFKDGINRYLINTDEGLPKSLAELMTFNKQHADIEMPYFGQELFALAQAKGPLSDVQYRQALSSAKMMTQEQGIDLLMKQHNLDLIIAPTTGPAWKIDWLIGDHHLGSAASAAAISGYPHISLPMGYFHHLPLGLSMFLGKLKEGTLIEVAYAFEQITRHRQLPDLN